MAENAAGRLTAAEGRRFALTLSCAFAVLAAFAQWRGRDRVAAVAATLSALFLIAALTAPSHLGPVERAWTKLGAAMSKITSPVFLGIIYFVVFTPAGLIRRLVGKNPIVHTPSSDSYWKVREPVDPEIRRRSMERQF
jgi:hypothetical protein